MKSFLIFGHDNGKYAYDSGEAFRCGGCGMIIRDKNKRTQFDKLKFDISSTFDNELLISERIYSELSQSLDCENFEKAKNYHYVIPRKTVSLDYEKQKIKFGEKCKVCGHSSYAIGITPLYLNQEIETSGIYATDICFGDVMDAGANLTPAILVSEDVLNKILGLKPTGLDYERTNC